MIPLATLTWTVGLLTLAVLCLAVAAWFAPRIAPLDPHEFRRARSVLPETRERGGNIDVVA